MTETSESCILCASKEITDLGRSFTHHVGITDYRNLKEPEKDPEETCEIEKVSEEQKTGETHIMCDTCIKDFVRVCTCEKPFRSEPTTLTVLCPCPSGEKDIITRLYFDIDHKHFLDLLSPWNDDYHIIEGCRGCRYEISEIQTNFKIGLQAAIEACVYKKFDVDENNEKFSAMTYQSDALDDDFVKEVSKYGVNLGPGSEI